MVKSSHLNPDFTFDKFVVGSSNSKVHSVAQLVSQGSRVRANPLILCGWQGLGKTHLLHAIGNEVAKRGMSACYIGLKRSSDTEIDKVCREILRVIDADTLLLDDLDHFQCSKVPNSVMRFVLDYFVQSERQVVATSTLPLARLVGLNSLVEYCLESGECVRFDPPDTVTKQAMLIAAAEREGIDCSCDLIYSLSRKDVTSLKELEGLLICNYLQQALGTSSPIAN